LGANDNEFSNAVVVIRSAKTRVGNVAVREHGMDNGEQRLPTRLGGPEPPSSLQVRTLRYEGLGRSTGRFVVAFATRFTAGADFFAATDFEAAGCVSTFACCAECVALVFGAQGSNQVGSTSCCAKAESENVETIAPESTAIHASRL